MNDEMPEMNDEMPEMNDEMPEMKVVSENAVEPVVTLLKLAAYAEGGVMSDFLNIGFKSSTAITVGRFTKLIFSELKARGERQTKLGKQYGEKGDGEQGDSWKVVPPSNGGDKEKWDSFKAEMKDLDKVEVDLSAFTFRAPDFKNAQGKEAEMPGSVTQMLLDLEVFEE